MLNIIMQDLEKLSNIQYLIILFILYLIFYIYYFLSNRKNAYPENYPYEQTFIVLSKINTNFLEYIDNCFKYILQTRNIQTFSCRVLFNPIMIFTNNPKNIEYILKLQFHNYEKGPTFRMKMNTFLGSGIFNSDSDIWYQHRKISAHLFNLNIFRSAVMNAFNEHMDKVFIILDKLNGNNIIDFQLLMHKYTLDSIGKIAFGIDINSLNQESNVSFASDFDYVQKVTGDSLISPFWFIDRYFSMTGIKYHLAIQRMNKFANDVIEQHRHTNNKEDKDDDDDDDDSSNKTNDLIELYLSRQDPSNPFTNKYLRDVVLNFIIAGRDTTAQALSWTIYRLCQHPEIQVNIRNEVKQVLEEFPNLINSNEKYSNWFSYEILQKFKYIEAVIMEVIRLHPSVPKEMKQAVHDDVFPDGTQIRAGDQIIFCPWVMGRTESIWEDCLTFKPERFLNNPKPSPFVFTAFQAGPRTCLGQNLAILEMKCCLARLLLRYDFVAGQDLSTITYINSLTLPIKNGILVKAIPVKQ